MSSSIRPRLLVVFYSNPDHYPPTFNAVTLLKRDFDVRIVCRKSERETRLWPAGVRIDRIGPSRSVEEAAAASSSEKVASFVAFVWAVRRALAQERPAVVLAYEAHAFVALQLARCRAPIVYQRHEIEDFEQVRGSSFGHRVSRYAAASSNRAALMVFPESHRADYYQQHIPLRQRPLIIPNFPLLASFPAPDWDAVMRARTEAPSAIYRGQVGPGNGVAESIRAMPMVDSRVHLRVYGAAKDEFMRDLRDIAQDSGVGERVSFAGFVPFDELNRQAPTTSVGLMPYQEISTNWIYTATANNKLYEYAACGLPAIAPARQSFQDYLGSERWIEFVDVTSPRAIAEGINRLLADPASYERCARAARCRFEEEFNYDAAFEPLRAQMLRLAQWA